MPRIRGHDLSAWLLGLGLDRCGDLVLTAALVVSFYARIVLPRSGPAIIAVVVAYFAPLFAWRCSRSEFTGACSIASTPAPSTARMLRTNDFPRNSAPGAIVVAGSSTPTLSISASRLFG